MRGRLHHCRPRLHLQRLSRSPATAETQYTNLLSVLPETLIILSLFLTQSLPMHVIPVIDVVPG